MNWHELNLLPQHRQVLEAAAIDPEVAAGNVRSVEQIPDLPDPFRYMRSQAVPAMLFTWNRVNGDPPALQIRPDNVSEEKDGSWGKYRFAKGHKNCFNCHPLMRDRVQDESSPIIIVEGTKQYLAAVSALARDKIAAVGISGCWGWSVDKHPMPDLSHVPWGRDVYICMDADLEINRKVWDATRKLAEYLKSSGAKRVRFIVMGDQTQGLDDVLGGIDPGRRLQHIHELLHMSLTRLPKRPTAPDADDYSDVNLSREFAEVVLGEFKWAVNRDRGKWYRWSGKVWHLTPIEDVQKVAGDWILNKAAENYTEASRAIAGGDTEKAAKFSGKANEWKKQKTRAKLANVVALLGPLDGIRAEQADFDRNPDLLNCNNGVVDLRTGEMMPHDPDLFMTKITKANYEPNAVHTDWDAALSGLPADVRPYFQLRCGQAVTGYMTPDDKIVFSKGSGENGKSTAMYGIQEALGEYVSVISERVVATDSGNQHPTEITSMRGARFVLLEELPEEKRLAIERVKKVTSPQITARAIAENDVTWDNTSSIFIGVNHDPVIKETDHGTWRRLLKLNWPFTFWPPHEYDERQAQGKASPRDRRGDTELRDRIKRGTLGRREAVLAWLVAGAVDWYRGDQAAGRPPKGMGRPPESVERDTRAWRAASNPMSAFCDAYLIPSVQHSVLKDQFCEQFLEFLQGNGSPPWGRPLIMSRLKEHAKDVMGVEVRDPQQRMGSAMIGELSMHPDAIASPPSKGVRCQFVTSLRWKVDSDYGPGDDEDPGEPETPAPEGLADTPSEQSGPEAVSTVRGLPAENLNSPTRIGSSPETPDSADKLPLAVTEGPPLPTQVRYVRTYAELEPHLAALLNAPRLGVDVETTGLSRFHDNLCTVQIAAPQGLVVIVDCRPGRVPAKALQPVLDFAQLLIFHNGKFDLQFLEKAGLRIPIDIGRRIADTMLRDQAIHAGDRTIRHSLADLCERYLGRRLDKTEQTSDWSGELSQEQIDYAARDAMVLLPIHYEQEDILEREGLLKAAQIDARCLPAIAWLEMSGAPFDRSAHALVTERMGLQVAQMNEELELLARPTLDLMSAEGMRWWPKSIKEEPEFLNWNSGSQVMAFFSRRGVELQDVQQTTLARVDDPIAQALVARAGTYKLYTAFGEGLAEKVDPDGRIRANYSQCKTVTCRTSCSDPNLQQIPKRGDGAVFRTFFRAPGGRLLIRADYSQIELRMAAQISRDPVLMAAYENGEDLHAITARKVMGAEPGDKVARQRAKAGNFGLLYGMGAPGLQTYARNTYGVEMSLDEATEFRNGFFREYKGLRKWHRSQSNHPVDTRTIAGRRRKNVLSYTEKLNTPVQGSAADGMKLGLALLFERKGQHPDAFPVLTVHDELVVEGPEESAAETGAWLKKAMVDGMSQILTAVPVDVEVSANQTWKEE